MMLCFCCMQAGKVQAAKSLWRNHSTRVPNHMFVCDAQESEGEDAETSRVVLEAPAAGRAGRALVGRQSRVRLHEVGPRLEMEIVKVRHFGKGCSFFHPF
jgi:hypothetical protein